MLYSCWSECPLRIVDMKLNPIVDTKTPKCSSIDGWYHSEFQNGLLNFSIELRETFKGGG